MKVTISSTTWCTPYLPPLTWLTTKMRLLAGTNFLDMCPWTDNHGCHPFRMKSIHRVTNCQALKYKRRDQLEWLLQVSRLLLNSGSLIPKNKKSWVAMVRKTTLKTEKKARKVKKEKEKAKVKLLITALNTMMKSPTLGMIGMRRFHTLKWRTASSWTRLARTLSEATTQRSRLDHSWRS